MARQDTVICDQCGKGEEFCEAVEWVHLEPLGIEAKRADKRTIKGDFCSSTCIVEFLGEGRNAKKD